ncbi:MAG: aspartyl protease family protein, partial [Cytophagales bacterium]|nr:aspartyl protease family protein [Cytophagales bacterium]
MKNQLKHRKTILSGAAKLILIFAMILAPAPEVTTAQSSLIHLHFVKSKTKKTNIRFKLVNNLIIVPVFINGSDTLRFILDTGVSHTMITSLGGAPGLSFNYAREIELFGLGKGREVKAYHSFGNVLELPGIQGFNHNIIMLKDEFDYLSQGLGTQIHGLLGYDVFDSFVVEINYKERKLTLYDPKFYRARRRDRILKKAKKIDMEIMRRKPFITAALIDEYNQNIDAKLLVDSGASHAISLFTSSDKRLKIPENSLYTFIGVGLSGDIYGHIGRAKRFSIGDYKFKKPLVTYPDEESVNISSYDTGRIGSIGADILKRFTVIFDYKGKEIVLKSNTSFKDDFKYNLSGIDVTTPIPDIPVFEIVKIRKGSP